MQALDDIRVLDFTTLLPGPMATPILAARSANALLADAEPGAEVS